METSLLSNLSQLVWIMQTCFISSLIPKYVPTEIHWCLRSTFKGMSLKRILRNDCHFCKLVSLLKRKCEYRLGFDRWRRRDGIRTMRMETQHMNINDEWFFSIYLHSTRLNPCLATELQLHNNEVSPSNSALKWRLRSSNGGSSSNLQTCW